MTLQFTPEAIAFLFTTLISTSVAVTMLRRRRAPGSLAFAGLMLAVAEWTFFRALEAMAFEMSAKIFWAKLEYPGIVTVPIMWCWFTLEYSRHTQWLTRRNFALLWIIPTITVTLALTNEMHHLIWSSIVPGAVPGANLIYNHGLWFWIHVIYNYALMVVGTVELLRDVIRFPQLYRRQLSALLVGAALPWLGNVIYVIGLSPAQGLDLTPFAFTISGVIYALGVFRFQLLDIVPIARDALIENMMDGVLVLDAYDRVVDINPAAQQLIGTTTAAIGQPADIVFADYPALIAHYRDTKQAQAEVRVGRETPRYLDLRISALYDSRKHYTGRLIVLRDITAHKRTEAQNQALLDAIPDVVLRYRADGTCLAYNSVNHEGLVTAPDLFVGKTVTDVLPPDAGNLALHNIQQAIKTGKVQTYEYAQHIYGQEHYFQARMEVCAPDEVLAVVRDVTERKRIEAELRRINQRAQTQVEQIEELQAQVRDQALRNPLTGLFNRRYLTETLERELTRAARDARSLSVAIIEIDHREQIADTYGHTAGDQIAQALANILREQLRLVDIACHADQQFVMVLPGAGADVALHRAEQWRALFEATRTPFGETELVATISVGIAAFPFHGNTGAPLLRAAAQALAAAQDAGHNRIVVWQT